LAEIEEPRNTGYQNPLKKKKKNEERITPKNIQCYSHKTQKKREGGTGWNRQKICLRGRKKEKFLRGNHLSPTPQGKKETEKKFNKENTLNKSPDSPGGKYCMKTRNPKSKEKEENKKKIPHTPRTTKTSDMKQVGQNDR